MAKDGLLCFTKQLIWPGTAHLSIAQPGTLLISLSSKKLANVAIMVLILTVTQWTICLRYFYLYLKDVYI